MEHHRNGTPQRALCALILGAAGLVAASAAHADNRAAQKLGQIGVINQSLQSKPPKSSPGVANTAPANAANGSNIASPGNGGYTGGPRPLPGTGGTPPAK